MVNDLPPGSGSGVEVHLRRLISGLERAGDAVEAFWPPAADGLGKLADLWNPSARRRLSEVVRRFGPDVIHFHNISRELSASVLGVEPRRARVMTFHDHRLLGRPDTAHQPRTRAAVIGTKCWVERQVARRHLDAAIAFSDDTERLLVRSGFGAVQRLELFADPPPQAPPPAGDATDVVFVGRLSPDKGIHVLVEAFTRIAPRHPQVRLVVAGDGPGRPALERAAHDQPGRIVLLGAIGDDEVAEVMARARVVAAPSIQSMRPETGPQTIMEGALAGRPVITARDVPMAEIVRATGGPGLVSPGSVTDLEAALDLFCGDAGLATEAGQAARRHATAVHTTDVQIPRVRALYRSVAVPAAADR